MSSNKGGTYTESKASFGQEWKRIKCKKIKNLSQNNLIVNFANFWHWEETEDSESKGIEARGGDNSLDVTKSSPMPQGEHGKRPPQHDRGGQDRYHLGKWTGLPPRGVVWLFTLDERQQQDVQEQCHVQQGES